MSRSGLEEKQPGWFYGMPIHGTWMFSFSMAAWEKVENEELRLPSMLNIMTVFPFTNSQSS